MKVDEWLKQEKASRKKPSHHEEELQIACVNWFKWNYPQYEYLLHHSPNGGRRNKIEAGKFKRMGTRAGFPDLILCMASGDGQYHSLGIEMKYGKGSQSSGQVNYETIFEQAGNAYRVCRSLDEFARIIRSYIDCEG